MPIRPENRSRYPKDWRAIRDRVVLRSDGQCECRGECGEMHDGPAFDGWQFAGECRCRAQNGLRHPETRAWVVLTVAHLDHTPENCDLSNLRAMCQRCHNRYDAPVRAAGRAARKRALRACGDLLEKVADQ